MTGEAIARPVVGVSICVVREGRALLAQRSKEGRLKGYWTFPGGHVEWGETQREAALRELKEETGVEAEIRLILDTIDIIHRTLDGTTEAHYVLTIFGGKWLNGEAVAMSDAAAVRWVAPDELEGLTMAPRTADLLLRAIPLLSGE